MTTEERRESLDRAVEEARAALWIVLPEGVGPEVRVAAEAVNAAISHLEAAVSAKARAEERERLVTAMVMAGRLVDEASLVLETALLPTDERARSSEEAGG